MTLRMAHYRLMFVCLALVAGRPAYASAADAAAATPDFVRDVQPVLVKHCSACHNSQKKEGGLDLTHAASVLQGGQSGPAVAAGRANESLLIERLVDGSMPPEDRPRLSDAEVAILREWINQISANETVAAPLPLAAADVDYWAFQRAKRPEVPQVAATSRVRTPVDAFLLDKLEAAGLTLSPDAAATTLLRRVTFDLTGLPPTPKEVEEFAREGDYERLVDRLLASPHYGERWGRHWLDAAGYADTVKTDNDIDGSTIRDGIWKYRDYVVRSLNDDQPYDEFVREQLAGDEMLGVVDFAKLPADAVTPEMRRKLIATGMLRVAVDGTNNVERNRPQERHELLFDTIENLTSNLFGLTVACARCHDHKFDPISQRDYYGLVAWLTPAYNLDRWLQPQNRHLVVSTEAEIAEIATFNKDLLKRAGELGAKAAKLRKPVEVQLFESRLAALPEAIREDVRAAITTPAAKRTEIQKYLFEKFDAKLKPSRDDVLAAASPEDRAEIVRLETEAADLKARQRAPEKIQALYAVGDAPETRLLRRGNFLTPGPIIAPAIPRVLSEDGDGELPAIDECHQPGSGRRFAAAQALTAPHSRAAGLLARVAVNRLWQHHFGRGIVATPGNLGRSGDAPSHPELLEWLAADLIEGGWKLKRLHKTIVMSTVYRQRSSTDRGGASAEQQSPSGHSALHTPHSALLADPDNRLLSHYPLRRLESEAIRDAVLAASGRLDRTIGGPPVLLEGRSDGMVVVKQIGLPTPTSAERRSLYLLARRNFNYSLLSVFDQPLMGTNCVDRNQSAAVSQSLAMMNDAFVLEQADHLAARVTATAGTDRREQIRTAFLCALSRPPSGDELAMCEAFLARQTLHRSEPLAAATPASTVDATSRGAASRAALADLCHMLLNTNEFLYIE